MATINIKSPPYNALGNGVADDTAAIQAAVDDAIANGDDIEVPAGTYLLRPPTNTAWWNSQNPNYVPVIPPLPANQKYFIHPALVCVRLEPKSGNKSLTIKGNTILGPATFMFGTDQNLADVVTSPTLQNIVWENLTFSFDPPASTPNLGQSYAMAMIGVDGVKIVNCTFAYSDATGTPNGFGPAISNSIIDQISDCTFRNMKQGMNLKYVTARVTTSECIKDLMFDRVGEGIDFDMVARDIKVARINGLKGVLVDEYPQLLDLAGGQNMDFTDIAALEFGCAISIYDKVDAWPTYADWYGNFYVKDPADRQFPQNDACPVVSRILTDGVTFKNVTYSGFFDSSGAWDHAVEIGRNPTSASDGAADWVGMPSPKRVKFENFSSYKGWPFLVREMEDGVLNNLTLIETTLRTANYGALTLQSTYNATTRPEGKCSGVVAGVTAVAPVVNGTTPFGIQINAPRDPAITGVTLEVTDILVANAGTGVTTRSGTSGVKLSVAGMRATTTTIQSAVPELIEWPPLRLEQSKTLTAGEVGRAIDVNTTNTTTASAVITLPAAGLNGRSVGPVVKTGGTRDVVVRKSGGTVLATLTNLHDTAFVEEVSGDWTATKLP